MGAGQEVLRFLHQRQVQETPHGRLRPQPQYNLQINYVSRIDRFVSKATSFKKNTRDGCWLSHIEKRDGRDPTFTDGCTNKDN